MSGRYVTLVAAFCAVAYVFGSGKALSRLGRSSAPTAHQSVRRGPLRAEGSRMIHRNSLRVLAVDLAASVAVLALDACAWCARCYRRLTRHGYAEAVAAHPASQPPRLTPRPLTVAEQDDAYEAHIAAQARAVLVEKAGWRYPLRSLLDIEECEAIGNLPTYDKEDHR